MDTATTTATAIQLPSLAILLILIPSFTFAVLKLARRCSTNKAASPSAYKLPPGPRKLPLIGNLHQLALGVPHRVLADLAKKHGPLMHLQLGQVSTVVVSSPEAAKQVMKTHDISFASRPPVMAIKILYYNCTDIAFSPYGDYWRQIRKICILELLSSKRVQSFRSIREQEFTNLVHFLASNAGSPINLTEKVMATTYNVIARAAFGKKSEDHETFVSTIKEVVQAAEGFNIADVYPSLEFLHFISGIKPKLEKFHARTDRILEKIIQEHRRRKSSTPGEQEEAAYEDLVDVLLKFQQDSTELPLSNDNIKAVLMDVFGAGGDTSSVTVDWAMSEMLKNPRILEKAQAEVRQLFNTEGRVDEAKLHELKYLKAVIKETLRLHPAGPLLLPRECREACQIDGFDIPVKTKVIVNAWAIGRDPRYWENPECFMPERFLDSPIDYKGTNFEYIPFGSGRRMCPGMPFGLANVELPLAMLLYHLDWKLPGGMKNSDLDMMDNYGLTVRRKDSLFVIPIVYNP